MPSFVASLAPKRILVLHLFHIDMLLLSTIIILENQA